MIEAKPDEWSDAVAGWLLPACYYNPDILQTVRDKVNTGQLVLVGLYADGVPVGAFTAGIVRDGLGADLFIDRLGGQGDGLAGCVDDYACAIAREMDLDGVRFVTAKPGMVRLLGRMDYRPVQTLVRKGV